MTDITINFGPPRAWDDKQREWFPESKDQVEWPDNRPARYPTVLQWLRAGFDRQTWAFYAALAAGWTALPFALWFAAAGAFVGGIGAVVGLGHIFGYSLSGPAEAVGFLGLFGGAAVGAVAGFMAVYTSSILSSPGSVLVAVGAGVVFSAIITAVIVIAEPMLLTLRGYRRMSRREATRVEPLLVEAARSLGLTSVPPVLISDELKPAAFAHLRAIVLTRGLLGELVDSENPPKGELTDEELSAILIHELYHWSKGDPVGLRFVWAAALPIALFVNAGGWLRERTKGWFSLFIWLLIWPAEVLLRFLIVPVEAKHGQMHEYEADAAAAYFGHRQGMRRALASLSMFEPGRTDWEAALASTHPPTELRLEALEASHYETPPAETVSAGTA
jgi:Zn-dependent protease with chaperone function